MNRMYSNLGEILGFLGFIVIGCVFFIGIWFVIHAGNKANERLEQKKAVQYSECKDRTTDVEWCVRTVYEVKINETTK